MAMKLKVFATLLKYFDIKLQLRDLTEKVNKK